MVYKIDISSGAKIQKFVDLLNENNITGTLETHSEPKYIAKGNSVLGALGTMEWKEVYFHCFDEVDDIIKEFIIEKVDNNV